MIATVMIATVMIATVMIATVMIATVMIATVMIATMMSYNSHLGGGEGRQVEMCTRVLRHRTLCVFLQEKNSQTDRQMVDMETVQIY